MSEERFIMIESKLDSHDRDLHGIAKSLDGINHQMQRTNEILQEFALKDERFNAKIEKIESSFNSRLEQTESLFFSKIDSNSEAIKRAHSRTDKIDAVINRLAWTVITVVIVGMITAVAKFG